MPTENRRVATYLPKNIDDRFESFKAERGLKGDSPALLTILSEFFGVTQEVAYQGGSEILQRVEVLESKLAQVKGELLSELKSELLGLQTAIKRELLSELYSSPLQDFEIPGQLELLQGREADAIQESLKEQESSLESNPMSELINSRLEPMGGHALSQRFGLAKDSVAGSKKSRSREKFIQWTKEKDPDGIAWEYHENTKKYHPLLNSEVPVQVNPIAPEGSERSEEG